MRARLITLLREKSVRTGTFTLASGKTSDFYVDVRQTSLCAEGAWLLGNLLLDRLEPQVTAIGGMTLGADPLASAAATVAGQRGLDVNAFLIRKQPKGHGVERFVVGRANLEEGQPVAMVEDTTTTGGSLLEAIERAEEAGLVVAQVITIVDREEGARERLAAAGYPLDALTTRTELLG